MEAEADWIKIFLEMQEGISSFKKPLRTLDKQGKCWPHVRAM